MARRFLLILVAIVALAVPEQSRAQPAEVEVTLVAQPVWHAPGDPLGLRVRLANPGPTPVEGYIVTVAAHGRVLSRSALHESLSGPATFQASLITAVDASDESIAPGDRVVHDIDQPVGALQSLDATNESGVYPLEISVVDASGAQLGSTSTQLIYYPTPPEFRLPAVPIVTIADLPHRDPDGTFAASGGSYPLEDALRPRGWLSTLLTQLDRATTPPAPPDETARRRGGRRASPAAARPEELRIGLVVMPRLAEELADMADGYPRDERGQAGAASDGATHASAAVDSIRRIATRPSVQPILSPYSFPDLPSLFDAFADHAPALAPEHLEQHLLAGGAVLQEVLGRAPSRNWIYSAGGRVNHVVLEELQQLDAARFTFFAEEALETVADPAGGGCPEPLLSFACPVAVTTSFGRSTGYVLDQGIQERVAEIAAGSSSRSALQRLFAETAMIREEVPSRTDRVVAIALPDVWEPRPQLSRLLFMGLRDAPWLQTHTPREALSALREQVQPTERRIRSTLPRASDEPDDHHVAEIVRADEVLEDFRRVQPPPDLVERLMRNMLVSESRLWWRDPAQGERYAEAAADEAQRELGKITIGGSDEIALTSRQAEIPVVVFNDNAYDVNVTVRITSADLRLDETSPITVQARGLRQLSVDVSAESSGIFTVYVTVETPNGALIDRNPVQVRSTEFNEIALGLTFGALAFLVLFYVTRALRSRTSPEERHKT